MKQSTIEMQKLDAKHHLHPFSNFGEFSKSKSVHVIEKSAGVYIYNSEGQKILDAMSGLWCVNMGYGQQSLIEAANKQMQQLPFYNLFFGTTHPPAVELSKLISEVSPKHINQVFFTSGGSEANDTMVRMVRHFWAVQGKPEKKIIISRNNAYHGSTMAGASLGGMERMHKQGGLPIPDIVHISQPDIFGACVEKGGQVNPIEFGRKVAQDLEDKIDELGEGRVAAFIAEPIQGAGGVIIPPENYWPEISRICKERDILIVADEVICGFGRTGEWFGSDYYNIEADLMPIAKGLSSGYLPIGGLMVSDRVNEVLCTYDDEFEHGFTYSGHPTCAAVAVANIKLMQQTNIVDQVKNNTIPYLSERWRELSDHPLVGESRSVGMLGALEIVENKENFKRFNDGSRVTGICRDFCFENGIVMRAVGDKMIICPPLIINNSEIDEMVEKAWKSLDQTAKAIS
jgi:putrescine aminotransferase